jgi:hypothetical protein
MKLLNNSLRLRSPYSFAKLEVGSEIEVQGRRTITQRHVATSDTAPLKDQLRCRDSMTSNAAAVQQPLLSMQLSPDCSSCVVTCNGIKGTLIISNDGGVSFQPLEVISEPWPGLCCSCVPQVLMGGDAAVAELRMCCPDCRSGAVYGAQYAGQTAPNQK